MINVAICTPTAGSVKASYCASLVGMMTHFFNTPIKKDWSLDEPRVLTYNLIIGSNISSQREQLVEDALIDPSLTHVLFIDDDMGYKPHCLNLALSRQQPVVLANYRRKAPPWEFTSRRMEDGRAMEVPTTEASAGLEEITFGGFGFCLIEVDVLRKMKKPRFLNKWIEHQQLYSTEDVPFFQTILDEKIAVVQVDHELSRNICHVGDYQYQYDTQCSYDIAKHRFMRPVEIGAASL